MTRVLAMFAVAIGAVVALAPGHPRADGARAIGFDHRWHEGKVSVAGGSAIQCQQCHAIDAQGLLVDRPGHGACFGDCHGAPPRTRNLRRKPYEVKPEQRRVCVLCHAENDLKRLESGASARLTVPFPPYAIDRDHRLVISHARHAAPSQRAQGCRSCHDLPSDGRATRTPAAAGRARPNAHKRCASCHATPAKANDAMPTMQQCSVCHPQQHGQSVAFFQKRGPYPVTRTFSHRTHADRGASDCLVCHTAVNRADGEELPVPDMAACATCHDGKQAFSTVGVQCRKCHVQHVVNPEVTRPRPGPRFEHRVHLDHGGGRDMTCTACHKLDKRGAPLPPGADHAPCSDAGCHREDFAESEPKICGACHIGIEPWRELHFDRPLRPDTEFGAVFSHRGHLSELCAESDCQDVCTRCHRSARGDMDRQLPRDHTGCMGEGCHTKATTSPQPSLRACERCHTLGLMAAHQRARTDAQWSVRARFRHKPHATDPRTSAPLVCTSCHVGVAQSAAMDDIATPTKATCVACHDGDVAFKITGHGCARCHAKAGSPR